MKMKKLAIFLPLLFTICNTYAAKDPMPYLSDKRLKTFVYNHDEIFHIKTHHGISTEIVLAPYETIKEDTVIFSQAGIFTPDIKEHSIVITPRTLPPKELREFNLSFDTNLRSYIFMLHPPHYIKKNSHDVTYRITFEYPQDAIALVKRRKAADKKRKDMEIVKSKNEVKKALNNCENINLAHINRDYTAKGSMVARPLEIFNDKKFTYIKIDKQASITTLESNGVERVLNSHPGCGYRIVEAVYKNVILTVDGEVTCLINNTYDANRPKSSVIFSSSIGN